MGAIDWDRWAAATGIGFVVAFVFGFVLIGDEPGPAEPASEVASWLASERSTILTAAIVFGVAIVFLLWFAGSVAHALREAGQPRLAATAFAGAVAFAVAPFAGVSIVAGLAFNAGAVDPGVTGALFDVHWAISVVASFPFAVFIGATALAARRSGLFGAWYAWASEVVSVLVLLGGTVWASDGFWSPDGAFAYIAFFGGIVWVLVTSVLLLLRPATAPAAVVAPTH